MEICVTESCVEFASLNESCVAYLGYDSLYLEVLVSYLRVINTPLRSARLLVMARAGVCFFYFCGVMVENVLCSNLHHFCRLVPSRFGSGAVLLGLGPSRIAYPLLGSVFGVQSGLLFRLHIDCRFGLVWQVVGGPWPLRWCAVVRRLLHYGIMHLIPLQQLTT